MVRLGEVVLTYFVIGAVLWGSGIIDGSNLGVANIFFDVAGDGSIQQAQQAETLLDQMGNSIQDVAGGIVGPILAIWSVIRQLISVLFWPVVALASNNAPPSVVMLLGGTPTVAFFMGVIRAVRESA